MPGEMRVKHSTGTTQLSVVRAKELPVLWSQIE
jgi:hypothetical protein